MLEQWSGQDLDINLADAVEVTSPDTGLKEIRAKVFRTAKKLGINYTVLMNIEEAKLILSGYRPDGQDAGDPQFQEALQ